MHLMAHPPLPQMMLMVTTIVCVLLPAMDSVAFVAAAIHGDQEADASVSSCQSMSNTNVTSGTPLGLRRFSVTAQDCCTTCSVTAGCLAAVWTNTFFCQLYSEVHSVQEGTAAGAIYMTIPTTPVPTMAPTPAPTPRPPPTQLVLLTTCGSTSTCNRSNDPSCHTIAVPMGGCALYTAGSSSSSRSTKAATYASVRQLDASQMELHVYTNADCTGTAHQTETFPSTCTFNEQQLQYMSFSIVGLTEKADQQISWMTCTSPFCSMSSCSVSTQETTGSCSEKGQLYYCVSGWTLKFSECSVWTVATAGPLDTCYYDEADVHHTTLCS